MKPYEIYKKKEGDELLMLMRIEKDEVATILLSPEKPISSYLPIPKIEVEYLFCGESIGNFMNRAAKMYDSTEQVRKLIFERESEMSAKKAKSNGKAPEVPEKVVEGVPEEPKKAAPKKAVKAVKTAPKKATKAMKAVLKKEVKERTAKKAKTAPKAAKKAAPKKGKVASPKNGGGRISLAGQKISVLSKKIRAREGTKRYAWLEALITSKTVAEARTKVDDLDSGVLNYAKEAGYISLS